MRILIRSSVVVVAVVGLLFMAYVSGLYTKFAGAAVAYFNPSTCYTGSATTSLAYMTPGKSTSTVTCVLGDEGARSAVIAVQVTASTTNTQYRFGVEESMDGVDWYPIRYGITASTSPTLGITTDGLIDYQFASSTTIGGVGGLIGSASTTASTGNNRNSFTFDIPVRMKRVRVWTALASSTAVTFNTQNGAVWLQIIPRQDVN